MRAGLPYAILGAFLIFKIATAEPEIQTRTRVEYVDTGFWSCSSEPAGDGLVSSSDWVVWDTYYPGDSLPRYQNFTWGGYYPNEGDTTR